MAIVLVSFLLFFLYLIVIPIGISPFEGTKVILAEILIVTLLILKIFHLRWGNFKHLINPHSLFIGILFILSLAASVIFQSDKAFFGNVFRLQGLFLFWLLLVFSILSKNIKIDKIPQVFYYLSFIFLVLATVILGVNVNNRAFGTLGEPNALAATTLFLFPFVWFHSKSPITRSVLLLTALVIILLTGSRAGLIGLMIQSLFLFLNLTLKISSLKAVLISTVLILASLTLPFVDNQLWFENRAQVWLVSFKGGLASPLIGHGFGNIQNIIHKEAVLTNNNVQYQVVDSSHNFLLDFWVQGGIVGATSILILIILSFHGLIKTKRMLELTAFLGVICAMLFNPVSVITLLAFWWLIGQGFSDPHHTY